MAGEGPSEDIAFKVKIEGCVGPVVQKPGRTALQAKGIACAKPLRQERAWIILRAVTETLCLDAKLIPLFPLYLFPNATLKSGHYYPIAGGNQGRERFCGQAKVTQLEREKGLESSLSFSKH